MGERKSIPGFVNPGPVFWPEADAALPADLVFTWDGLQRLERGRFPVSVLPKHGAQGTEDARSPSRTDPDTPQDNNT